MIKQLKAAIYFLVVILLSAGCEDVSTPRKRTKRTSFRWDYRLKQGTKDHFSGKMDAEISDGSRSIRGQSVVEDDSFEDTFRLEDGREFKIKGKTR